MDVDDASRRRLTNLGEDSMIPVWSRYKVARFQRHFGLYVIDAEGKELRRLADEPTGAGLAWLNG